MRAKNLRLICLALFGFISIVSCEYKVRNVEACAVAGIMSAGMDCANTLSDATRSMNLDKSIEFLEPQVSPPRAGAICMSAEDFNNQKTDIEVLCRKMGSACTLEAHELIDKAAMRMDLLQVRTKAKKKPKKN